MAYQNSILKWDNFKHEHKKNRFKFFKSCIRKSSESLIWIYDKLNLRNFNIILNKQKIHLKLIGQYGVQTNVGQMWPIEFYTCLDIKLI